VRQDRDRDRDRGRKPKQLRRRRKKACLHCVEPRTHIIDFKNLDLLRQFVDDRGRIRKARQTGNCRKHQARVAAAIKRAREIALLPYVVD
jgi:small subunit ribosomal protein S18